MTNTTDIYWEADGVSLQTFAQNIETMGGRLRVPPLRGSDTIIPHRLGEKWNKKQVGSQTLSLKMWVRGTNPDGTLDGPMDRKFHENWRELTQLLFTPGRQFQLTKRFYVDGSIRSATALAEYAGGLEPQMIGKAAGKFYVDLKLADPYFYDDTPQTFNLVAGAQTISVQGDSPTSNILVNINGPRVNPQVAIGSPTGVLMQYVGDLSTDDLTVVTVRDFSAITTPDGVAPYDSSARINHSGDTMWLVLQPGDNSVTLSSSSGAGLVQLVVRGAWL